MDKKYASIYLMGGFGNQLFQFCFAKSVENSNLKVYIDKTNYLLENKRINVDAENRDLIIPIEDFGFSNVPRYLNLIFFINNKLRNYSFRNYKFFPVGRYNDKNFKGCYSEGEKIERRSIKYRNYKSKRNNCFMGQKNRKTCIQSNCLARQKTRGIL